jgi:hypothetical protein
LHDLKSFALPSRVLQFFTVVILSFGHIVSFFSMLRGLPPVFAHRRNQPSCQVFLDARTSRRRSERSGYADSVESVKRCVCQPPSGSP